MAVDDVYYDDIKACKFIESLVLSRSIPTAQMNVNGMGVRCWSRPGQAGTQRVTHHRCIGHYSIALSYLYLL